MKYFLALFVSIIFIACKTSSLDDQEVKLLFKSGFEDGVYLDTPYNDGGGTWMQDIKGSDDSKFSFPINIWETKGSFQVLVDSSVDSYEYIQNKIIATIGHTGEYTKVLSSEVLKADKSWTQDPYILEDAKEDGDLYISYWLKLPAKLPLKQLVDDIEIYDGFPCGEGKSCYEK